MIECNGIQEFQPHDKPKFIPLKRKINNKVKLINCELTYKELFDSDTKESDSNTQNYSQILVECPNNCSNSTSSSMNLNIFKDEDSVCKSAEKNRINSTSDNTIYIVSKREFNYYVISNVDSCNYYESINSKEIIKFKNLTYKFKQLVHVRMLKKSKEKEFSNLLSVKNISFIETAAQIFEATLIN